MLELQTQLGISQQDIIQITGKDDRYYHLEIQGEKHKLISVTSVLSALLPKPALVNWAFNIGVEETVSLISKEAARALTEGRSKEFTQAVTNGDAKKLIKYLRDNDLTHDAKAKDGMDRGNILHKCLEARIAGEELPEGWEECADYVGSLDKFLNDYQPTFHASELKVVHLDEGYAGTLDAVCTINSHPSRRRHESMVGKRVVFDLKTNKDGKVYPQSHLPQVSAYGSALEYMGGSYDHGMVIAIGPESYSPIVNYYDREIFGSFMKLYKALDDGKKANPNGRSK